MNLNKGCIEIQTSMEGNRTRHEMNLNKGCIEISDHRLGVDSWKEMNLNKGCIEMLERLAQPLIDAGWTLTRVVLKSH